MKPLNRQSEGLSVQEGCVLWGSRVIVHKKRQKEILKLLHDGHSVISRMKGIARSFVWWHGLTMILKKW